MDPTRWRRVSRICAQALEHAPAERDAFVESACGDDADLRAEVTSLLEQETGEPALAERSLAELSDLLPTTEPSALAGTHVGPYRVVRSIASGGMGQVLLAVREGSDFEHPVALKVIRRGMDTDELLRRFRSERRILAGLDHPGIARLLDGGASEEGTPYFVMEYIEGLPITEYCRRNELSVSARLELFEHVCAAGHYAHKNLVVHRDLKPSNILVTAAGVPKLLDFGIAKVFDPDADEPGDVTRTALRVMTPEYASPEQVRGDAVTTASDIYSLGVLLYELLCGRRPFEGSPTELQRAVLETEAPRASSLVAPSEARLARRLRGDLDNILGMALRKEPERRYASLQQFADDLERHRRGRPVAARRDTALYVARKFVQRNPAQVLSAAVLLVALAAFAVVTSLQAKRVAAERDTAEGVTEFLVDLFRRADPRTARGGDVTARALLEGGVERLERLRDEPHVQVRLMLSMGRAFEGMDMLAEAESVLRRALGLAEGSGRPRDLVLAASYLGVVLGRLGRIDEAIEMHTRALEGWRQRAEPGFAAFQRQRLGWLRENRGEYDAAERLYRESAAELRDLPRSEVDYAETLLHLGHLLLVRDGPLPAEAPLLEARAILERLTPPESTLALLHEHLGKLELAKGNLDAAEVELRRALEVREAIYGTGVKEAMNRNELAIVQRRKGDLVSAEENYRRALETLTDVLGERHWLVVQGTFNLGRVIFYTGRGEESVELLWRALEVGRDLRDEDHPDLAHLSRGLAEVLLSLGRANEAEPVAREAWRICRASIDVANSLSLDVALLLARALASLDRRPEARELLDEVISLVETREDEADALATLLAERARLDG